MSTRPVKKQRIRDPVKNRQKLLQTAIDLIAEKGVEAVSLKEVAKRADLSRSVTYLHFKDRDHLIDEAKNWISRQLQDGVKNFDDSSVLFDRVFYTTKLVLQYPDISRVMMVDALMGGGLDLHHPLYKQVLKRLRKLQREGRVRKDADLGILTFIHLGSIASTLLLGNQHGNYNVDKLTERFTREWCRVLEGDMFVHQQPK